MSKISVIGIVSAFAKLRLTFIPSSPRKKLDLPKGSSHYDLLPTNRLHRLPTLLLQRHRPYDKHTMPYCQTLPVYKRQLVQHRYRYMEPRPL